MRFFSVLAPLALAWGSTASAKELPLAPEAPAAEASFESPCLSGEQFFRVLESEHDVSREEVPFSRLVIAPNEARFELTLVAQDGSSRSLFDISCQTLVDTALVIVASWVHAAHDSNLTEPGAPKEPVGASDFADKPAPKSEASDANALTEPGPPLLTAETPKALIATESAGRDRSVDPNRKAAGRAEKVRFVPFATLGSGVSFALHPTPAFFVELGGGIRSGKWGSTLFIRYHFPSQSFSADGAGLRLESASARLAGAYFPLPWLAIELGPSLSWLSGRGVNVSRPASSAIWLAALELDASVVPLRTQTWAVGAGVRGFVSLNNPRFELDDGSLVYSVPRGGAGIFLHGIWSGR